MADKQTLTVEYYWLGGTRDGHHFLVGRVIDGPKADIGRRVEMRFPTNTLASAALSLGKWADEEKGKL